jgi:tRNA nucleotidyltransferase/poly(A) polymerase
MEHRLLKFENFIFEKNIPADIPIPNDIMLMLKAYNKAGKDFFIVGGAVRDFVQGKIPHDYDLVTNALPAESKKILKDFDVSDEQGKNFGVLRIFTKDEPLGYEIATYRKDISKGRNTKGDDQKVEIGKHITIEDDCKRRDLTMNALFYDIDKKLIVDLVGGIEDIKNGIVKAVGDPKERFDDDRLRILRIFRFAARTGGKIDQITEKAIVDDHRLTGINKEEDVSQERIWIEIKKAWDQSKDFNTYLEFFTKFDMWGEVFPGSNINTKLIESDIFIVNIANLFKNEDPGSFLSKSNELETRLIRKYKMDSDSAEIIVFLLRFLDFDVADVFDVYKKKIQYDIDDSIILEWLKANSIDEPEKVKFVQYKPSISINDLMNSGLRGSELGEERKKLEAEEFKKIL